MAARMTLTFDKDRDLDASHRREITVWLDEEHLEESKRSLNQLLKMAKTGVQIGDGSEEADPDKDFDSIYGDALEPASDSETTETEDATENEASEDLSASDVYGDALS